MMVLWPASAHTIAKLHMSMADDLITCVIRAWDPVKPLFLSPSAHPLILCNPLLSEHLRELTKGRKMRVVPLKKRERGGLTGHLVGEREKLVRVREMKRLQEEGGGACGK